MKVKKDKIGSKNLGSEEIWKRASFIGAIVFCKNELWMVVRVGKTFLHSHPYIRLQRKYKSYDGPRTDTRLLYKTQVNEIDNVYLAVEQKKNTISKKEGKIC